MHAFLYGLIQMILKFNFLVLCCVLLSYINNLKASPLDVFVQLRGADGKICQGTRIENKIITSALCVCNLQKVENELKDLVDTLFKKKKPTKISLLNTSLGSEVSINVNIYKDDHACRFFDSYRNENPEAESSKMIYDRYYFDVAILEIVGISEKLTEPKTKQYPSITCVRPRSDDFATSGRLGIITRDLQGKLEVNSQRFALRSKPNYWFAGLELFFTGYRITTLDQHFSTDENQNGAPLFSQAANLILKNELGRIVHTISKESVNEILENENYAKLFIPGIVTHGQKVDENKGRAIYSTPFFNVKKLLKKHIPAKYLSSECLTGDYPEGFVDQVVIY